MVDSLQYSGPVSAGGHPSSSSALQNLDVVARTSVHDALDSLLLHAAARPAPTPAAAAAAHAPFGAAPGCVLNPIDKLYSMQTSYFNCAD